jgi:hypothetical protein
MSIHRKSATTSAGQPETPEGPICCALSLGKGAILPVATKHNSTTFQATPSKQGVIQGLLR